MGLDQARAWYVISLRPQGQHAALQRVARGAGLKVLTLSPWKLVGRDDSTSRGQLRDALAADAVLFTSPAAVRFAAALQPLRANDHQAWIATGAGTRAALRRAGIAEALAPARMDSEGLLDLPQLADLHGRSIGLVTAPDGRGTLAPALIARGGQLHLAEVYQRQPLAIPNATLQRLRALPATACLALSSGGALQQVMRQLSADDARTLHDKPVVAASARLVRLALEAGFTQAVQAEGPRPAQMIQAAHALLSHRFR